MYTDQIFLLAAAAAALAVVLLCVFLLVSRRRVKSYRRFLTTETTEIDLLISEKTRTSPATTHANPSAGIIKTIPLPTDPLQDPRTSFSGLRRNRLQVRLRLVRRSFLKRRAFSLTA